MKRETRSSLAAIAALVVAAIVVPALGGQAKGKSTADATTSFTGPASLNCPNCSSNFTTCEQELCDVSGGTVLAQADCANDAGSEMVVCPPPHESYPIGGGFAIADATGTVGPVNAGAFSRAITSNPNSPCNAEPLGPVTPFTGCVVPPVCKNPSAGASCSSVVDGSLTVNAKPEDMLGVGVSVGFNMSSIVEGCRDSGASASGTFAVKGDGISISGSFATSAALDNDGKVQRSGNFTYSISWRDASGVVHSNNVNIDNEIPDTYEIPLSVGYCQGGSAISYKFIVSSTAGASGPVGATAESGASVTASVNGAN